MLPVWVSLLPFPPTYAGLLLAGFTWGAIFASVMSHIFIFSIFIIPQFRSGKSDSLIAAGVSVRIWLLMKSNQAGLSKRNTVNLKALFKEFQLKNGWKDVEFSSCSRNEWRQPVVLLPSLCGSQCCWCQLIAKQPRHRADGRMCAHANQLCHSE